MRRGLLDTSVLVAMESGRALDSTGLPDEGFVSVVTMAELRAGVLAADETGTRARRLATLELVAGLEQLPVDDTAAASWAVLRIALREAGRAMRANDLWIASVAHSQNLAVVTQDDDFAVLAELGLVEVVRV